MEYYINKENDALYIKVNGAYYPFSLSHVLHETKYYPNDFKILSLSAKDFIRYGVCYDNVTESLTEVTVSQLTAMANK